MLSIIWRREKFYARKHCVETNIRIQNTDDARQRHICYLTTTTRKKVN